MAVSEKDVLSETSHKWDAVVLWRPLRCPLYLILYSVSAMLKVKDHSVLTYNNPVTSLFFPPPVRLSVFQARPSSRARFGVPSSQRFWFTTPRARTGCPWTKMLSTWWDTGSGLFTFSHNKGRIRRASFVGQMFCGSSNRRCTWILLQVTKEERDKNKDWEWGY